MTTGGDGLLTFPGGRSCLFATGTLPLGTASGQRVVMQGSPFPTEGALSNFNFGGPFMGSVFLYAPGSGVSMNNNSGLSNMAFLAAPFEPITIGVASGGETSGRSIATLTAFPPYSTPGSLAVAITGNNSCVQPDTTAQFSSTSKTISLSHSLTCATDTSITLGFQAPTDLLQSQNIINAENNIPSPIQASGTADTQIENLVVIGATQCINATPGTNVRFNWSNMLFDCQTGIALASTPDEGEISNLHMYPFLNSSSSTLVNAVTGFVKVGSKIGVVVTPTGMGTFSAGETVLVTGAGSDPGVTPVTNTPVFDGKFQIQSVTH